VVTVEWLYGAVEVKLLEGIGELGQVPPGTFKLCPSKSLSQSMGVLASFRAENCTCSLSAIL
jgi:hypothetical protein